MRNEFGFLSCPGMGIVKFSVSGVVLSLSFVLVSIRWDVVSLVYKLRIAIVVVFFVIDVYLFVLCPRCHTRNYLDEHLDIVTISMSYNSVYPLSRRHQFAPYTARTFRPSQAPHMLIRLPFQPNLFCVKLWLFWLFERSISGPVPAIS